MKFILAICLVITTSLQAQYIGVRARYTETRLVDDAPNPPKRENHLILSFYEVLWDGTYIPTTLTNYDLWVWKEGLQFNAPVNNAYDSTTNNMQGYSYTAPRAVAYYNSFGLNYIECDPDRATHYTVNGHELDCGFINVSYWGHNDLIDMDGEIFTAPNICLPFYFYPDQFYLTPGNVNFYWPPYEGSYLWYNYLCQSNWNQFVVRGVLGQDTGSTIVPLPVRFVNVRGETGDAGMTTISWSNMTESDVQRYEVEMSVDGINFTPIDTVLPNNNFGGPADYTVTHLQTGRRAYYRIRATENNGSHFYSVVISLSYGRPGSPMLSTAFSVYPNPVVDGNFTIQLRNARSGRYVLSVTDQQGKFVCNKIIQHNGGDISQQVELFGLFPGIYQVVLWSSDQRFTEPIVYVH